MLHGHLGQRCGILKDRYECLPLTIHHSLALLTALLTSLFRHLLLFLGRRSLFSIGSSFCSFLSLRSLLHFIEFAEFGGLLSLQLRLLLLFVPGFLLCLLLGQLFSFLLRLSILLLSNLLRPPLQHPLASEQLRLPPLLHLALPGQQGLPSLERLLLSQLFAGLALGLLLFLLLLYGNLSRFLCYPAGLVSLLPVGRILILLGFCSLTSGLGLGDALRFEGHGFCSSLLRC